MAESIALCNLACLDRPGRILVAATLKVGPFYLVSADHVTANVSVLELFAALGAIGWLGRSIFKLK